MERETIMELIFRSATNRKLREEELLNYFRVAKLEDIPTETLIEFCNKYYCTK